MRPLIAVLLALVAGQAAHLALTSPPLPSYMHALLWIIAAVLVARAFLCLCWR